MSWLAVGLAWCLVGRTNPAPPGAPGPYNVTILQGGIGMTRSLPESLRLDGSQARWSLTSWVKPGVVHTGRATIAALGDPWSDSCVCLELAATGLELRLDATHVLSTDAHLAPDQWAFVAVTFDGQVVRLYAQGEEAGNIRTAIPRVAQELRLGPELPGFVGYEHFGGSLGLFQLVATALSSEQVRELGSRVPDFSLVNFTDVGAGWPVQSRTWPGLSTPQDPWTLPRALTAARAPRAAPLPGGTALRPEDVSHWTLMSWRMQAAPQVGAASAELSQPGFDDRRWYAATVPGTVLTTLIDRGVYPDPDFGLNNLSIPESLARQDYWYRTEFRAPQSAPGRRLTLLFQGINYAADVWVNGHIAGHIRGAFIRGSFDVSGLIRPGKVNAVAVRISPPPHPGIPSEESMAYGPGENGGSMALDGPTFIATEGWDWIPGIRDRDSGLWQPVSLIASGAVRAIDPTVTTHLPLPRTDEAELGILVPLVNEDHRPRWVTVRAAFEGTHVSRRVLAPPGRSEVRFTAGAYPALRVRNPRLWWPNGYGAPDLYTLHVEIRDGTEVSDATSVRFGIREITYELSLFDHQGRLRRVEVDPAAGSERGERLIDTRHEAIKQVPNGWAQSLTTAGETSPAVHDVPTESLSPFLVIRVNGTPIAARGGSWGMDDSRKRSSRERLEPYFRLHREAGVNIIRNWLGQNTEEVFYDLADEYGLLILNDFWVSTQDFQLEPQDPALFLANAADVISRFRNHPSIAVWFGRNEGVPQPILNEGLADLVARLDGTRLYTGSSNRVNLQDSGPYNYRPPAAYFTELAKGFAVEVGTPSLATLESIEATVPKGDRWPIGDTLAYHDWHFGGNGDVASFMSAVSTQYGAPASLEDFERKAQMMNYVDYRAIFEGFAAHLWTQNSGRLIWMTHPAWPSNHWQMYSSDYDTQASYYGVKKACESLHVQMNLPDYALAVVNTTRVPREGLRVRSRVLSLEGQLLNERTDQLSVAANQVATLASLHLNELLIKEGAVLVALALSDGTGRILSENFYWQSSEESGRARLAGMPDQKVAIKAHSGSAGGESVIRVELEDLGSVPVLAAKVTLVDSDGARILPAYFSDNYLTLLPGERRALEIRYSAPAKGARVQLRGWNVLPAVASATALP